MDSQGGGGLQGYFRGKVWCPPMMQANRTQLDGHPRQQWETGDVWGGWSFSTSRPKVWLIWTLLHPWWYGVVFKLCVRLGFSAMLISDDSGDLGDAATTGSSLES